MTITDHPEDTSQAPLTAKILLVFFSGPPSKQHGQFPQPHVRTLEQTKFYPRFAARRLEDTRTSPANLKL